MSRKQKKHEAGGAAEPTRRADRAAATLSFLIPLAVFVLCMAPDVVIEGDSGEIISAVHGFGIIHSPGFPSYMVMAKAFSALLGFLDIARAVNLFSAVGGAMASLILYLLLRPVGGVWVALIAAATLVFASEFWYAALSAEVYTWALSFMLLPLLLIQGLNGENYRRRTFWLGMVVAWGVGLHVYIWALLPLIVWFTLARSRQLKLKLPVWRLIGGAVVGLCSYLYIPLRAGRFLWVNEGGIDSFSRFFDHVTWIIQRERVATEAGFKLAQWFAVKGQQIQFYLNEVARQWSWLGLLIGVVVVVGVWRRRSKSDELQRISLAGSIYFPALIIFVFSGREFRLSDVGENSVHLMTFYLFITIVFALSLAHVVSALGERQRCGLLLLVTAGLVSLTAARWATMNISTDRIAVAHGRDLLVRLAPDAIFIGDSDNDMMPTVYQAAVRALRPDVIIVNMANGTGWYYENLKKLFPQLTWPTYTSQFLARLIRLNSARPVYFSNAFGAYRFLESVGLNKDFEAVPLNGAFRLSEKGRDWKSLIAEDRSRPFELAPQNYSFQLRGREADVIAQRADYELRLAYYLFSHNDQTGAREALERGLAYPTLPLTEFGQYILKELNSAKAAR